LLAVAAITATIAASTSAGNTHYCQPILSTERLAVTLTYLATGKTSCADRKVGRQLWKNHSVLLNSPHCLTLVYLTIICWGKR